MTGQKSTLGAEAFRLDLLQARVAAASRLSGELGAALDSLSVDLTLYRAACWGAYGAARYPYGHHNEGLARWVWEQAQRAEQDNIVPFDPSG